MRKLRMFLLAYLIVTVPQIGTNYIYSNLTAFSSVIGALSIPFYHTVAIFSEHAAAKIFVASVFWQYREGGAKIVWIK